MNKIVIGKNKIYYATFEDESKKWSKKDIERLGKPITWYLPYEIEFEKAVSVRDLLLLLKKHEEHINLVFCGYLGEAKLSDFLAELDHKPDENDQSKIEVIEFYWNTELESLAESPDPEEIAEFHITTCPSIRGLSSMQEDDEEDNIIFENEMDLALIALRNYADKIISLNSYIEYSADDGMDDPLPNVLLDGEMNWTLFDLISSFLSEISYYGTPEDQKIMHDEIMKETSDLQDDQTIIEPEELFTYLDSLEQRLKH